jgi:hypothetical protein
VAAVAERAEAAGFVTRRSSSLTRGLRGLGRLGPRRAGAARSGGRLGGGRAGGAGKEVARQGGGRDEAGRSRGRGPVPRRPGSAQGIRLGPEGPWRPEARAGAPSGV